jgi:hypothetical protein
VRAGVRLAERSRAEFRREMTMDDGEHIREHGDGGGAAASRPPRLGRIFAARVARTAAGGVWIVCGLALLATGLWLPADERLGGVAPHLRGLAAQIVVVGVEASAIAWAATYAIARLAWPIAARRPAGLASLDQLARASLIAPLVGVALFLPLASHLLFAELAGLGADPYADPYGSPFGFDSWVRLSALHVGHCHVLAAVLAWRFARRVAREPHRSSALAVYAWTVLSSVGAGVVVGLTEPRWAQYVVFAAPYAAGIVAVTGAFLLPAFPYLAWRHRAEVRWIRRGAHVTPPQEKG